MATIGYDGRHIRNDSAEELLDVRDTRHKAFHTAIAAGCSSPLLKVRESLFDQVERYRHLWLD